MTCWRSFRSSCGAGGVITTWEGGPPNAGGRVIAAGDKRVHAAAMELLKGIDRALVHRGLRSSKARRCTTARTAARIDSRPMPMACDLDLTPAEATMTATMRVKISSWRPRC